MSSCDVLGPYGLPGKIRHNFQNLWKTDDSDCEKNQANNSSNVDTKDKNHNRDGNVKSANNLSLTTSQSKQLKAKLNML